MPFRTFVLVITITGVVTGNFKLNPKGPMYQTYSTDCIVKIARQQFVPHNKFLTILATSNMTVLAYGVQTRTIQKINRLLKWSLEIVSGDRIQFESGEECLNCYDGIEPDEKIIKNIFQAKVKADYCLMIVDSYEHFVERLQDYKESVTFSFRSYFLIYFSEITANHEEMAMKILSTMWENKIFNSAVIIARRSLKHLYIFGLDLYEYSKICGRSPELILLDNCREGVVENNTLLFGNKLPRKFHNCSLKAVAMPYPPYVINSTEGFEVDLLHQLGQILDINFLLTIEEDAIDWGTRISNKNWTGPLQSVLDTSSIAIGNVMADPDLAEDFDLSIGYFYEHMVWVVPAALPLPQWKSIFVIFTYELWLACIAYFILTAFLFQCGAKVDKKEINRYKNLGTNFLSSLSILTGVANPKLPKTMLVRVSFLCLATYSMILIVLYQSLLMTHLTNPVYEHQISSVQEILDSPNGIGGLESYKSFFNESVDKVSNEIYEMFEIYDPINDTAYNWLLTVANDRDTCTVISGFYVRYLIAKQDPAVYEHGTPRVFILKDNVFVYPIRMVLPKGFPLRNVFDDIIGHLINGGIIDKWTSDYRQSVNRLDNAEDGDDDDDGGGDSGVTLELTMDHLQGAFTLLLFGYAFGIVALLLEILVNYLVKSGKVSKAKKWFHRKWMKCKRKKQV